MPKDIHNATLAERIDLHEDLALFRVKYNDHDVPDFEPGQFATLGLPDNTPPDPDSPASKRPARVKLIRRAYSIASPSSEKRWLEFYIVHVDHGKLTDPLWDIKVGDTLFMNPRIGGHFTLEPVPTGKNLVMVGTGTGLAPFRSMLLTYDKDNRWDRFALLDGCRVARDLGYRQEMEQYAKDNPNFVYLPTVTREPDDSDWPGARGRVTSLLEPERFQEEAGFALDPATCHVFLCGNPQMIDQTEAALIERGFVVHDRKHPDGNIHFERYW